MTPRPAIVVSVLACLAASSCSSCGRTPAVTDAAYREAVTAFYTALAALETSQEVLARQKLDRALALVPQEPAVWANLGLLLLRQQELGPARERLAKAEALAPSSAHVQRLIALTEGRRGDLAEAIRHWRRAVELDPADVKAAYALAVEIERQGGAEHDAEAQRVLEGLLAHGENLPARLDYARLAAKRGDAAALERALAPLVAAAPGWPSVAQEHLKALQEAASGNPRAAATRVVFLKNVLVRDVAYRRALSAISTPLDAVGEPVARFLVLPNPAPQPAEPDLSLTFSLARSEGAGEASWVGAVVLGAEASPVVASASAAELAIGGTAVMPRRPARARAATAPAAPAADAVLAADLDYDFRTDLVVATAGGVTLLRQTDQGRFDDVTGAAGLPAPITSAPAYGAWPADVDTDGDLDVVLAPVSGAPIVLRNNGDGTFAAQEPFAGCTNVRGFVWADLDGEGVPDATLLDESGTVHVFVNLRGGSFAPAAALPASGPGAAIAAVDGGGESGFAIAVLSPQGAVRRLENAGGAWRWIEMARADAGSAGLAPGAARLLAADLDNNGAADLVVSGPAASRVLLADAGGAFTPLAAPIPASVRAAADLDGDGRLELLGVDPGRHPVVITSRGAKSYHWQALRPRAASATGDQRINSFGIGGEAEVRTGLHVQRRLIASPIVHFGLGNAVASDVIRITWPNGVLQSEFERPADAAFAADQRLKGSCPWLFAWNGREMAFVTDLIWRSPLGLRINAQATADVLMTEDWVRVRGDQLVPRDGAYDLRVTAELWETHFFDLVSLMVVDHPAGTEVFVDERFAVPPPALRPVVTGAVQPMAEARDPAGRDVSDVVQARDDRHLGVPPGAYQGVARDHFVELALPETAPRTGPLWLVAQGWVHPTDSSINVAMAQGSRAPARGLALQVADETGRFRTVRAGLGFPAGKDKTVLIDLAGVFRAQGPRRLRLATNLEVYWDRLGWAVGRPDVRVEPRRLPLASAELRFRGYSVTGPQRAGSPERPRYQVEGTAPRWLDLEGYHTRFGDVRDLVRAVDDRYVIMNAGDELALRFPEAPPPAAGLVRDFIVIGDGWVKDGDFNTSFSRTVLPLPTHASGRYDAAPAQLEDDPVYKAHASDFADYHTRYVTPARARRALGAPAEATRR